MGEGARLERGRAAPWLESYVKTVVGHYRGRVDAWDVVNEPLAADGSLRRNFWLRELGPGYVADALSWAREANPGARLYVNDFNIEGRSRKTRRDARTALAAARRGGAGRRRRASRPTSPSSSTPAGPSCAPRCGATRRSGWRSTSPRWTWPSGRAARAALEQARIYRRGGRGVPRPAGLRPLHHLGIHRRVDLARHREAPAPVHAPAASPSRPGGRSGTPCGGSRPTMPRVFPRPTRGARADPLGRARGAAARAGGHALLRRGVPARWSARCATPTSTCT